MFNCSAALNKTQHISVSEHKMLELYYLITFINVMLH